MTTPEERRQARKDQNRDFKRRIAPKWVMRTLEKIKGKRSSDTEQLVADDRRGKKFMMKLPGMTARQLIKHRKAHHRKVVCACVICRVVGQCVVCDRRRVQAAHDQLDEITAARGEG